MLSKLLIKLLFISLAVNFIFKSELDSVSKASTSSNNTFILFCFYLTIFLSFVQRLDFVSKEQLVIKINNKKVVKNLITKISI